MIENNITFTCRTLKRTVGSRSWYSGRCIMIEKVVHFTLWKTSNCFDQLRLTIMPITGLIWKKNCSIHSVVSKVVNKKDFLILHCSTSYNINRHR